MILSIIIMIWCLISKLDYIFKTIFRKLKISIQRETCLCCIMRLMHATLTFKYTIHDVEYNLTWPRPLDSHKAEWIIELKESHTKSFRFLKQICLSKFSHSYNQTECYYTNTLYCQAWLSTGIILCRNRNRW